MNCDLYERIVERLLALLEQGVAPWKSHCFCETGMPRNFASGKAYPGINVFLLACLRYHSPYFLTFLQAKELGGHVRKGEEGFLVIKYGTYTKEAEDASEAETSEAKRRFLKGYTVFNAAQIEGIAFPEPETTPTPEPSAACDRARAIVAAMPQAPGIHDGSAVPYYRRDTDSVYMPERRYFTTEEGYYSTLFHELTHATGHQSRLARGR